MTTPHPRLRQQVRAYADDVSVAAPPESLLRGRHGPARTRSAGPWRPALFAAASVVAVLALAIGGVGAVTGRDGGPATGAGEPAAAAIPDFLPAPSAWLPVEEQPGRAAAVLPGERKSLLGSSSEGVVVVSATTGGYTWLPTPGLGDQTLMRTPGAQPFALSPDGRLLAYWQASGSIEPRDTSLRIRDLVDGTERPARFPPGTTSPSLLSWTGDRTLAFVTVDWSPTVPGVGGSGTVGMTLRAVEWPSMDSPDPVVETPGLPIEAVTGTGGATYVRTSDERDLRLAWPVPGRDQFASAPPERLSVPTSARTISIDVGPTIEDPTVVVIDGGEVYAQSRGSGSGAGATPAPRRLPVGTSADEALGFRDRAPVVRAVRGPDELVVTAGDRGSQAVLVEGPGVARASVDVAGGDLLGAAPSYASDLWAVPTVSRPAPVEPLSPRLVLGGLAGVVLLAGVGLVRVRRRRRA